jgi:hypothetical protein
MIDGTCKAAFAAALIVLAAGCSRFAAPIALKDTGVKAAVDYNDLALVLQKAVTKDGLLIPGELAKHSGRLEAQLSRLAVTGPTVTPELLPTAEDRVAYWYNARAAWAMKLVLIGKCPKSLRRDQLMDRRFPLDGRTMSLAGIDYILQTFGDWRIPVAAPGVTLHECPLPAGPFAGDDIRRRIGERLNAFVDDGRRFVIDVERKRILVPPVLWQFRGRLIEEYQRTGQTRGASLTTAMLSHVEGSAHRRLQDAVGYRCVGAPPSLAVALLEKDWRIGG